MTAYYLPLNPPDDPNVVLIAADHRTGKVKVVTRTGYRRPNVCFDASDAAFVASEHPHKLARISRHQAAAVLAYARGLGPDRWADGAAGAVMQYHKREAHRMPEGVRWGKMLYPGLASELAKYQGWLAAQFAGKERR